MRMRENTDLATEWNRKYLIDDIGQFVTLPLGTCFVISLAVLVSHLTASFFFIRAHSIAGMARTCMMGVYTVVCVPLFIDWEEIFWSSRNTEGEPGWQFNRIFWPPKSWTNSSPTQSRSFLGRHPSLGGLLGGPKIQIELPPNPKSQNDIVDSL